MTTLRANLRIASLAFLLAVIGSPAPAEVKLPVPAVDQSMVAKRGYFYVGGHYIGESGKSVMQGQIYVEVLAPKKQRRPYPLVLIHGAAQTATNCDGHTGRPRRLGRIFRQPRLRRLHDRSADARPFGLAPRRRRDTHVHRRNEQFQFTAIESDGTWPGREKHTQWPGDGANKGKKGDPVFDAFYATQVETVMSNEETQQRNQDAGAALLDKIGPAIVLTHSQSGPFGWLIADARPKLVKAVVAIEPSGPPFENTIIGTGKGRAWGRTIFR